MTREKHQEMLREARRLDIAAGKVLELKLRVLSLDGFPTPCLSDGHGAIEPWQPTVRQEQALRVLKFCLEHNHRYRVSLRHDGEVWHVFQQDSQVDVHVTGPTLEVAICKFAVAYFGGGK